MITLASSSKSRAELLTKLGIEFVVVAPKIDESSLVGEAPTELVYRLAEQKAAKVAKTTSGIVIASDQVAVVDGEILGKPYNFENAIKQLKKCSNKKVEFLTSLCVLGETKETIVEHFNVYFQALSNTQIENYVQKDQPFDCAGSLRSEGLGVALFERFEGNDPNTLIGLPLIQLIKILAKNNIHII